MAVDLQDPELQQGPPPDPPALEPEPVRRGIEALHDLTRPIPRPSWQTLLTFAVIALVIGWGTAGIDADLSEAVRGLPNSVDLLGRMLPPEYEWSDEGLFGTPVHYPTIIFDLIETVQMAIVGTLLAIVLSIPFGLLAARNSAPHRFVYATTRILLNANRAVPEIVLAILLVVLVGPGPFSGVLALGFGSIGSLGKLYAEAFESIDPMPMRAVRATGASKLLSFRYGVLPQAMPIMTSYSLLLFEHNVRAATILGITGAGGIGLTIQKYIGLFEYQKLMGTVLLAIITVTILDRVSDWLRKRLA